jgi:hypothetical protein
MLLGSAEKFQALRDILNLIEPRFVHDQPNANTAGLCVIDSLKTFDMLKLTIILAREDIAVNNKLFHGLNLSFLVSDQKNASISDYDLYRYRVASNYFYVFELVDNEFGIEEFANFLKGISQAKVKPHVTSRDIYEKYSLSPLEESIKELHVEKIKNFFVYPLHTFIQEYLKEEIVSLDHFILDYSDYCKKRGFKMTSDRTLIKTQLQAFAYCIRKFDGLEFIVPYHKA